MDNSEIKEAVEIKDIGESDADSIIKELVKKDEIKEEIKEEELKVEKKRENEEDYEERFMQMIDKTSFGTKLREALEIIAQRESGALIVLSEPSEIKKVVLGGFKLNCKFSSERLIELSKMDGAIIVDPQLRRIYYANVLLIPDNSIPSNETGTRHQAAERTAKQTGKLVLAVSTKSGLITLYSGEMKYRLRSLSTLITRLQSVLDTLEEQKKIFSSLINYLNILEFTDLVKAVNIIPVVQKAELLSRGKKMAKRYLTELGGESHLLELRLKETVKNVEDNFTYLIRDYCRRKNFTTLKRELNKLSYDTLLESDNILKLFEFSSLDEHLLPKGYRILSKIPILSQRELKIIISKYHNLKKFIEASGEQLKEVKSVDEKKLIEIKKELMKLRDSATLSQSI